MTGNGSIFLCLLNSPLEFFHRVLSTRLLSELFRRLLPRPSVRIGRARILTLASAPILAPMGESMTLALSVEQTIESKMLPPASTHFSLEEQLEMQHATDLASQARERPLQFHTPSLASQHNLQQHLPTFRRGLGWRSSNTFVSPAALSTETAQPLSTPPTHLIDNPTVQEALHTYADSIKVQTPFHIDRLQRLLSLHPNRPFVDSVIHSLRNGFWPMDESDWPTTVDENVGNYPMEEQDLDALRAHRDKEVAAGHWTPIPALLPGMKTSPMFVVWQKNKGRIITDHTASGLNDGIPRERARVRYDDMRDFGQALYNLKRDHPNTRFTLFKSDVASAFLNLPVHPIWQLHQIVIVDGVLYMVHCLIFGNRASPYLWCAVSSLINWIAIKVLSIPDLAVFMDDFFGTDEENNVVHYRGQLRPRRQVMLLLLWEHIGCPFDDVKQLNGSPLKIIGFWVDINQGSISIPPPTINDTVTAIVNFISAPSRKHSLREWARLAGWLNWVLNVFPWGRPALTEFYRKMSGKHHFHATIFLNREVIDALTWLKDTLPKAIGVRFVDHGQWDDDEAHLELFCDASLSALAFVFGRSAFVYQIQPSSSAIKSDIFFLEELAIVSALCHVASFPQPPKRVLIWSDSLDSIHAFNTLAVSQPLHNAPLLAAASITSSTGIDIRVRHIDGKRNVRADMLSRLMLTDYAVKFPFDRVRTFSPPRELLPARWRQCF